MTTPEPTPRPDHCPHCDCWFSSKGMASHVRHCAERPYPHRDQADRRGQRHWLVQLVHSPGAVIWYLFLLVVGNQLLALILQHCVIVRVESGARTLVESFVNLHADVLKEKRAEADVREWGEPVTPG